MARFNRHVMPLGDLTVGDVLRLNAKKNPNYDLDRICLDYAGRVMLRGVDRGGLREVRTNLDTGRQARIEQPSRVMDLVNRLHSNLNFGPRGWFITLAGSLAMLVLTVSGATLLAQWLGGWKQFFSRMRRRGLDKWHSWASRMLLVPLFVILFSARA